MRAALTLPVAAALLAAACVPRVEGFGNAVADPAIGDDHLIAADGAWLPLRVWRPEGPPRAVFLALHGFNDYSKSFEAPATYWAERGILTYAYDQRGFGTAPHPGVWAGMEAMTEDLRTFSRLLRAGYPGVPLYAVGESMGGAVILAALGSDKPPPVDGAVLSAPAVRMVPWWQRTTLWVTAHTIPWAKASGKGFKIRPSDNIEMLRALGRDPLVIKETRLDAIHGLVDLMDAALAAAPDLAVPALVLYGRNEELVPWPGREKLVTSLPRDGDWRLAEYEKGYHMLLRDLNADIVLADIAAWATDPTAALPSGAERPDRTLLPPEDVAMGK